MVDPQGFEPQLTEPKSAVLPLHNGSYKDKGEQRYYYFFFLQMVFSSLYSFSRYTNHLF